MLSWFAGPETPPNDPAASADFTPPPRIPPKVWEQQPEDPREAARRHAEQARIAVVMVARQAPCRSCAAAIWSDPCARIPGRRAQRICRTTDGGSGWLCLIRVADQDTLDPDGNQLMFGSVNR
jgi:hypothetical protein